MSNVIRFPVEETRSPVNYFQAALVRHKSRMTMAGRSDYYGSWIIERAAYG